VVKRPALFFSLEMSRQELAERILASTARIDSSKLRTGDLSDADWNRAHEAFGYLQSAKVFIDDNPALTVMDVRARARRIRQQNGDLGVVIIDYLQLMSSRGRAENRQVEVSEMSRSLKILARELQCPVIALSQLSRKLEERADKRPMMSDLRESGSLEQDADVVLFIFRPEQYGEVPNDKKAEAEIIGTGEMPDEGNHRPLLVDLIRDGEIVAGLTLDAARTRYQQSLAELPARALQLSRGEPVIETIFEDRHH